MIRKTPQRRLGRFLLTPESLEQRLLLTLDLVSVSLGSPPDPLVAGMTSTFGEVVASTTPMVSGEGRFVTFQRGERRKRCRAFWFWTWTAPDGSEIVDVNLGCDVLRAATDGSSLKFLSLNTEDTATATFAFGVGSASVSIANGSGGRVAYVSNGFDLVDTVPASPLDWSSNVFVSSGGGNELVSINEDGTNGGNGVSKNAAISDNGRHVAFISRATCRCPGRI